MTATTESQGTAEEQQKSLSVEVRSSVKATMKQLEEIKEQMGDGPWTDKGIEYIVETLKIGYDKELIRIPNEAAEIIRQLQAKVKAQTAKNMERAKKLAWVECCHVTGMHDPEHTYVCQSQKAQAFDRICNELGIPPRIVPQKDCFWCYGWKKEKGMVGKDYRPKYAKEIALEGESK